jgi:hypothetical protein
VTDPRDDLDTWLQKQIDPMLPPPGTFELIKKRARRRKTRQALVSAASAGVVAAVVVLAVVALPKVVPSVLNPHKTAAANGSTAPPTAASVSASPLKTSPAVKPSGGTALPPVPGNFQATSVTFVGLNTGWVIGQAGTPGKCASQYCTSVARTDNTGASWYGVPAPKTGAPDGSTGVGQIRFLNTEDGWAFGPELWYTSDGGQNWNQVATGGQRVLSLETVGSEAFAVFAQCTGAGADYGSDCTSYTLYASPAGSDNWQPVPGMSAVVPAGTAAASGGSASLVLTPTVGYFYTPNGTILSGPVTGTQPWTAVSVAAQATSGSGQQVQIYTSTDGGSAWSPQGKVTLDGQVASLAANSGGELILAWSGGLDASADNGATWVNQEAAVSGGFSYVGLTDAAQGVAVPEQPQQQAVWFTQTGGRQPWLVSAVRS